MTSAGSKNLGLKTWRVRLGASFSLVILTLKGLEIIIEVAICHDICKQGICMVIVFVVVSRLPHSYERVKRSGRIKHAPNRGYHFVSPSPPFSSRRIDPFPARGKPPPWAVGSPTISTRSPATESTVSHHKEMGVALKSVAQISAGSIDPVMQSCLGGKAPCQKSVKHLLRLNF